MMISEICASARATSMALAESAKTCQAPGDNNALAELATKSLVEDIDAVGGVEDMSWDNLRKLMLLQARRVVKDLEESDEPQ